MSTAASSLIPTAPPSMLALVESDDAGFNVCPHAECLSDLDVERHSVQCREVDDGCDPDRAYDERGL